MAKHWITFLTNLNLDECLEQGLSCARQGHVLGMNLTKNRVTGQVQGTNNKPYFVEIRIKSFPSELWDIVITALAQQATLATAVIDGELPMEMENLFHSAGASLFPQSPKEFVAECSCPSSTNPCKHIAAIFCILAQEFVKNPFVMFMLRGKPQDALLSDLIEKRACIQQNSTEQLQVVPLVIEPLSPFELSEIIHNYWQVANNHDDLTFTEDTPPAACNILQTLGDPPGWPSGQNFAQIMQPLYDHVSKTKR
jgi:uncharacterized Zn finger protein